MKANTLTLHVITIDIAEGECANRHRCILALAANREMKLGGKGYVRVDANEISFTKNGIRYRYHPARAAMDYIRKFDEIGETRGLYAARVEMQPAVFRCTLFSANPIPPVASPARKAQINKARNRRNAELRAQGVLPRKPYRRYVGI
jgi:hypothetical protein